MSINFNELTFDWYTSSRVRLRPPTYRTDFDDKAEWEKFQEDHPLSSYSGRPVYQTQCQRQAFEDYTCRATGRGVRWCYGTCGNTGTHRIGGRSDRLVCDNCLALLKKCSVCENVRMRLTEVEGAGYCAVCLDQHFWHCANCGVWIRRNDQDAVRAHDHSRRTCTCEAQARTFSIRNDGQPMLESDTRATVQLPGGVIDAIGIEAMYNQLTVDGLYTTAHLLRTLDPKWQTKEGNFTKRLSKALYKEGSLEKLSPALLSKLGTIAADHSGKPMDLLVETTRNLNLDPASMGNPSSCWWGGFSYSRCTLKTLGGFGLRTFRDASDSRFCPCGCARSAYRHVGGDVAGRAWVLPLRRGHGSGLVTTRDAENAAAYVVFNGYGNLVGYTAPRLLGHMVGMSYKKVSFSVGHERMSINSQSAYLVGPHELLSKRRQVTLPKVADEHVNPYED